MPNHIVNVISGPSIAEIKDALRGEKEAVDFNRLIPMPDGLADERGMHIDDWAKLAMGLYPMSFFRRTHADPVASFKEGNYGAAADVLHVGNVLRMLEKGPYPKDFSDKEFEIFIRAIRALKETGFVSWYEWSIANWGTKWNAYSIEDRGDSLKFETAWSMPKPILAALCKRIPDAEFVWKFADEDIGSNLGIVAYHKGTTTFSTPDGDLEEWACRLHGYTDEEIAERLAEIAADAVEA